MHRPQVLARVMDDVAHVGAGHLVVTGDLVNLSLPDEFERARDWLAGQGTGESVTAIPGNHDALVPVRQSQGLGQLEPWMGEWFPSVKRLEGVALVRLSSALPTPPFMASGRLGATQLAQLETLLRELEGEGLFRIVLVHHPITEGVVPRRKALDDRGALRAVLARAGAELVLHGHSHKAAVASVPGPHGTIPVISAPSASAGPAGWNLIEIDAANAHWRLAVSLRSIGPDGAASETKRIAVKIARPKPAS